MKYITWYKSGSSVYCMAHGLLDKPGHTEINTNISNIRKKKITKVKLLVLIKVPVPEGENLVAFNLLLV